MKEIKNNINIKNNIKNNIKYFIFICIEIIHIFIQFIPMLILFGIIKNKLVLKLTLLVFLIIPLHWVFFNNECILTKMSNNLIEIKTKVTFVERRFKFIEDYFRKIFKKEPPKRFFFIFNSIVNIINLVIIWYIIFYKIECKPGK